MSEEKKKEICGIVMPISTIDSCSEEHWRDVKQIISEAIEDAGFDHQLVSEADDTGIIQKRIVQNLYENPIVVCDVSAKNPNVMFELGLRLAFDKPTIVIKDDKTTYSFDTSPVEHLSYPRDLRFSKIVEFKESLTEKIKGTYEKSKADPNYSTFLKSFGTFKIAELKTEIVPQDRIIIEEINELRHLILSLHSSVKRVDRDGPFPGLKMLCVKDADVESVTAFINAALEKDISIYDSERERNGHMHIRIAVNNIIEQQAIIKLARTFVPHARWLNGGHGEIRRANDG